MKCVRSRNIWGMWWNCFHFKKKAFGSLTFPYLRTEGHNEVEKERPVQCLLAVSATPMLAEDLYASTRPDWQAEVLWCQVVRSLPELWIWYFENEWTDFDVNCQLWSSGQGHETVNFGGQEVKDQDQTRLKFGCLAEASFSIAFSLVAFLILIMIGIAMR